MTGSGRHLRLVLVGWGAIARRVAAILADRGTPGIAIVAVAVRDRSAPRPDLPAGARLISEPGELDALGADMVVEAAGRDAVGEWGERALAVGCDFAVSSTSAFCDEGLLERLVSLAEANGRQVIVPPGALCGIEALAAGGLLGLDAVEHTIVKPPAAWRGTEAATLTDLDALTGPVRFFEGSAREAARRFPQNANVAVISALAGVGLDRTRIVLVADPGAVRNAHRISAEGAFGRLETAVENEPLRTNPKSSEMTALSLVRMLENRTCALVR